MKQHSSPCAQCPFRRSSEPGKLGGSPPEKYVGQTQGPFWLPCHMYSNFEDPNWRTDISKPQCAGAAIFRANVGVIDRMPAKLLHLPKDSFSVFGSFAEFYAHHHKITIEQAEQVFKDVPLDRFLVQQFLEAQDRGWAIPAKHFRGVDEQKK